VKFAVLNLQGRVFMTPIDDPFRKADSELAKFRKTLLSFWWTCTRKPAARTGDGRYLDGRVSGGGGPHTHVATADEHVFSGRQAYITTLA